jgi:hypothetical protein
MSTWKIVAMSIAWLFTSAFISVVTAAVSTEILRLVGVVTPEDTSYQIALNVVFVVVFVALISVPFVFRRRFVTKEPPPSA